MLIVGKNFLPNFFIKKILFPRQHPTKMLLLREILSQSYIDSVQLLSDQKHMFVILKAKKHVFL